MRIPAWVSHDRLEDEVMVIDMESGAYFALSGASADAWSLLASGLDPGEAAAALAERYGAAALDVADDVSRFVVRLQEERLLAEGEPTDPVPADLPAAVGTYEPPSLDKYDDLKDLLLLDPVHEVGEPGWPSGRSA